MSLAGSAEALGQSITHVSWTNTINRTGGVADGTNPWTAPNIPLAADKTNVVIVTATTTSWAPAFGGNTTFNDTLAIACLPIRASLALQGPGVILSWTNGHSPLVVQRATDLDQRDWTDFLTNAESPLTLPINAAAGFYRIVGQ